MSTAYGSLPEWQDEDGTESAYTDDDSSVAESHVHDYWYGQSFFQHQIARDVFYGARNGRESGDETLASSIHSFPYESVLKQLADVLDLEHDIVASEASSSYCRFVKLIGKGCRIRGVEAEEIIKRTIQRNRELAPTVTSARHQRNSVAAPLPAYRQDDSAEPGENPRYAMAWNEYLSRNGELPDYEMSEERHYPPLFRAKIIWHGRTYQGTGSRKKAAQHSAARKACEALDIPV